MTDIEIARLITAILISATVGYGIGFFCAYEITWHRMWNETKSIIKEHKITIEGWKSAYDELMGYWMESRLR